MLRQEGHRCCDMSKRVNRNHFPMDRQGKKECALCIWRANGERGESRGGGCNWGSMISMESLNKAQEK